MSRAEELRRFVGNPEKIAADLEQFTKDNQYVEDCRAELLAAYPDKWIAVLGEEVLGSADTLPGLLERFPREDGATMVIKLMETNPKPFILATK